MNQSHPTQHSQPATPLSGATGEDATGVDALYADAAQWQVRRQDGLTAQEEAQFQAWLAAGADRQAAYARLVGVWDGLAELHPDRVADLTAAVRRAPSRASSAARPPEPARGGWWSALARLAQPLATAAVAVSVVGAGWLGWNYWQQQPVFSQTYATARGQQLDVTLPDGSMLTLDTATRAEVVLYRDRRQVRLPEGQAMFRVKAEAGRPFDVLTDRLRITVVGTRFSVRNTRTGLGPHGVGVQVEEGRVRVSLLERELPSGAPLLLTAGQYVQAGPAGWLAPVEARPTQGAMLWREGRVNFDHTPLAQAVAEFERYGATGLVIKDPTVAALRVNASFDLRQADAFGKTLPLVLPVQLRRHGGVTEIVAAPPARVQK